MAEQELFKLNRQSKLILFGAGIFILGILTGVVLFASINEESGLFWVKPEIRMRASNYCYEHDYVDMESVKFISQKYYSIRCSHIVDGDYIVDSFEVYPHELMTYGR